MKLEGGLKQESGGDELPRQSLTRGLVKTQRGNSPQMIGGGPLSHKAKTNRAATTAGTNKKRRNDENVNPNVMVQQ